MISFGGALRRPIVFSLVCSLLLTSLTALAQSNYAAVGGTILDPQGHAFAGATVQLTSLSTHAVRQVTSNEQGIFQITGLVPDEYEMQVQASGFASLSQTLRLVAASAFCRPS